MTNKTQRTYGIIMISLGFIFLILNAVDYLAGWNRICSGFTVIGLALVFIGAGLYGLIVHGLGDLDWESGMSFAISLGIILPWIHRREKKQSQNQMSLIQIVNSTK